MLLCIMPLNQEQRGVGGGGGGFFRLDPVCALLPRTRRVLLYTGFDVEINAGRRVDEKGELSPLEVTRGAAAAA